MIPFLQPQTLPDFPLQVKSTLPTWPRRRSGLVQPGAAPPGPFLSHVISYHLPCTLFSSPKAFSWLQVDLVLVCLDLLFHKCCVFYKTKMTLSTSKKITIRFIMIPASLWWSGPKPAVSLRYACI